MIEKDEKREGGRGGDVWEREMRVNQKKRCCFSMHNCMVCNAKNKQGASFLLAGKLCIEIVRHCKLRNGLSEHVQGRIFGIILDTL